VPHSSMLGNGGIKAPARHQPQKLTERCWPFEPWAFSRGSCNIISLQILQLPCRLPSGSLHGANLDTRVLYWYDLESIGTHGLLCE
jgi:hypothetical protein